MAGEPSNEELEQTVKAIEKQAAKKDNVDEALREGKERYRDLVESINEVIWEVNADGIYTYVSPRAGDILGYEPEELVGKTFFEHMPPDEVERTHGLFMAQKAAPKPITSVEIKKTQKDGTLVFLESNGKPFFNDDGKLLGFRGACRDITGRKQAEEALRKAHDELERKVQERTEELLKAMQQKEQEINDRKQVEKALQESEEKLRTLVDATSDWIWEADLDGVYTYASPRVKDLLGYDVDEIIGTTLFKCITDKEEERAKEFFKEKSEVPKLFAGWEVTLLHKSGQPVTMEVSAAPIFDKEEKLSGWYGFDKDITKRKQTEKALKESEKTFRTIFENANDLITLVDEFGTVIDANSRIEDIFGYKREEVIGKNFVDFPIFGSEAMQDVLSETKTALNSGDTKLLALEVSRKDGSSVFVEVSAKVIQGDKGPIGILAVIRDITERKQAEEALKRAYDEIEAKVVERTKELEQANIKLEELDRLKSMFIASMSHELRTPLNSIIGFTGVILHGMTGEISAEQKDQLQRVYNAAKHLLALITDVIDISKIEAGKVEAHVEEVNLEGVIKEATSNISPEISSKGLDLEVSIPQNMKLKTDRKRLLQALLNYLSNAVKFSEKGKIRVVVDVVGELVEIIVEDTGIGIKEEDTPKLFQPFIRLDTHLKLTTPGTGLGLYLTKKLATEVLKGSVSAESIHGQGSTFVLKIPKTIDGEGGMT